MAEIRPADFESGWSMVGVGRSCFEFLSCFNITCDCCLKLASAKHAVRASCASCSLGCRKSGKPRFFESDMAGDTFAFASV
jgi:hypothetical protein